jgi:predicted RNA-binding protein associated with RNAse of E/G family
MEQYILSISFLFTWSHCWFMEFFLICISFTDFVLFIQIGAFSLFYIDINLQPKLKYHKIWNVSLLYFFPFLLTIALPVLPITSSDYPLAIFKFFYSHMKILHKSVVFFVFYIDINLQPKLKYHKIWNVSLFLVLWFAYEIIIW